MEDGTGREVCGSPLRQNRVSLSPNCCGAANSGDTGLALGLDSGEIPACTFSLNSLPSLKGKLAGEGYSFNSGEAFRDGRIR